MKLTAGQAAAMFRLLTWLSHAPTVADWAVAVKSLHFPAEES